MRRYGRLRYPKRHRLQEKPSVFDIVPPLKGAPFVIDDEEEEEVKPEEFPVEEPVADKVVASVEEVEDVREPDVDETPISSPYDDAEAGSD